MLRYIIILLLVFDTYYVYAKTKTRVLSLERCKVPDNKWDQENLATVNWSTNRVDRQTTIVYGNATVKNKVGPITVALRTYILKQDSSRDLVFNIDRVSCKKPLVKELLNSIKVRVDDDCNIRPSFIDLSNGLNVDDFSWLLTNIASTAGKYAFVLELNTQKGHIICMDIIVNINYT